MEMGKIATVPVKASFDAIHGSALESEIPVPVMGDWLEKNSSQDEADEQVEPEE